MSVDRASGAVRGALLLPMDDGPLPLRGERLVEPRAIRDGVLAWHGGEVTYAGPASDEAALASAGVEPAAVETLGEVTLAPGFVDCHTHLPFFGWRADEFAARLAGRTYRDLHGEGGIYRSARMLSEASDEEVIAFCRPLLGEMLRHGTTALELKTGYGLSVEAELRQARLARRLGGEVPQTCTVTLLACHAVPAGMQRGAWVDTVCRELIPRAAEDGLADAVDVYVEDIAFGLDDLRRVADTAREAGLALRCHADQLGPSAAAEAAAELGARSADHLNHLSAEGVAALGRAQTAAVVLPASTFSLRAHPPPVRELIEAGAALTVASDFNPGTSAVLSMPEAIAFACLSYGLAPATAVAAATANAAWVLGLDGSLGSLAPGRRADFVVLDGPDPAFLPYRPGHNPVLRTYVGGELVWERPTG